MQIKTKDELKIALEQLRATSKSKNSYYYKPYHPVMCYFRGFNDKSSNIKYVTVIGKHQCSACGKQFGENLPQPKETTATDKTNLLNWHVKIKNTIYQIHSDYLSFQSILATYQKHGFDCRLDYYCDDCVQSGKHQPLEFSIRFDSAQEYLVSFPQIEINEQTWGDCTVLNYQIALSFLTEHQDYQSLNLEWKNKLNNRESYDVKMLVDTSLVKVLRAPIFYDKEEIIRHYLLFKNKLDLFDTEPNYYQQMKNKATCVDELNQKITQLQVTIQKRFDELMLNPPDYFIEIEKKHCIPENISQQEYDLYLEFYKQMVPKLKWGAMLAYDDNAKKLHQQCEKLQYQSYQDNNNIKPIEFLKEYPEDYLFSPLEAQILLEKIREKENEFT